MKAILMVAKRELAERKLLFLVAGALGWVPVVAGMLPLSLGQAFRGAQPAFGFFLAASLACLAGLLFGGTAIPRELREQRLGFFFCRPISAGALWWGKNLAGVALLWGTAALAAAPTWIFTTRSNAAVIADLPLLGILPLACMAAAQVVMTILASRSLLLLGDLGALGIAAGVVWYCLSLFEKQGGFPFHEVLLWICAFLVLAILLAAHACGL